MVEFGKRCGAAVVVQCVRGRTHGRSRYLTQFSQQNSIPPTSALAALDCGAPGYGCVNPVSAWLQRFTSQLASTANTGQQVGVRITIPARVERFRRAALLRIAG